MRAILFALATASLAVAGCSGSSIPPETDPAKGREVLTTVLETWKRGGTTDELKKATPSIAVRDPDWSDGAKLVSYEIASEDARAGVDLQLTVKLTLSRDGKSREKTVSYTVGIGSATVVMRNE